MGVECDLRDITGKGPEVALLARSGKGIHVWELDKGQADEVPIRQYFGRSTTSELPSSVPRFGCWNFPAVLLENVSVDDVDISNKVRGHCLPLSREGNHGTYRAPH